MRNPPGYHFHDARVIESMGRRKWGLPPLDSWSWDLGVGEGTSLKLLRWFDLRGWLLFGAAALCTALPAIVATSGNSALAGGALEERKLPMRFNWVACGPNCRGWISAIGIVTADSPQDFENFARGRDLIGATVVLDSSGGSVNDSIALGRRFRGLGMSTTVGISTVSR